MCRCAELRKEKTFHSTGPFIVFCCCCYLLFTTFGRIGFKSRGILTFGPFGLLFVSFFMSASSRLAHEQTSIHKYPNLFHGCTACKYANVKLCVRSVVSSPRWANWAERNKDRRTPKSTYRNLLWPQLLSQNIPDLSSPTNDCFFLVQWWAWETKKAMRRSSVRDGIVIERSKS